MKKNKITTVMGSATIPAKGKVSVETDNGKEAVSYTHLTLPTILRV